MSIILDFSRADCLRLAWIGYLHIEVLVEGIVDGVVVAGGLQCGFGAGIR